MNKENVRRPVDSWNQRSPANMAANPRGTCFFPLEVVPSQRAGVARRNEEVRAQCAHANIDAQAAPTKKTESGALSPEQAKSTLK